MYSFYKVWKCSSYEWSKNIVQKRMYPNYFVCVCVCMSGTQKSTFDPFLVSSWLTRESEKNVGTLVRDRFLKGVRERFVVHSRTWVRERWIFLVEVRNGTTKESWDRSVVTEVSRRRKGRWQNRSLYGYRRIRIACLIVRQNFNRLTRYYRI